MVKVIISEDCGNSPKNLFIQKFTIAYAERNRPFLLERVTENVQCEIIGEMRLEGKVEFAAALSRVSSDDVVELTIHHAITHGRAGMVDGQKKTQSGTVYAFADVYDFENLKAIRIRRLKVFSIKVQE